MADITHYLAPAVAGQDVSQRPGKRRPAWRKVRGHRMAKAALENALWDAEASRSSSLYGSCWAARAAKFRVGFRSAFRIRIEQLLEKIETELAAGYRRIKLKVKPGWDVNVLEKVRARWPDISAELRRQLRLHAR